MIRWTANWLREHREVTDLLLITPLIGLSLLYVNNYSGLRATALLMITGAVLAPLIVRRRWPRSVFAIIALLCFGQWLLGIDPVPANFAVLIAMYTVAAEASTFWGLASAGVCAFGALLAFYGHSEGWQGWEFERSNLVAIAALVGGIWIFGIYGNTRRAYLENLEEKAARLERERDSQVQIAMAGERARIARELHDVVAHNVSVMVVQADGGAFMVESDPRRARQALETISETGRTALKEMRLLLGVLREGGTKGPFTPQPGLDQLDELIEQTRAAGLPVEVSVEGTAGKLPTGLQLTVYRIVQEALTNVLKHGGASATARIALSYGDDKIQVRVTDDGRGAAAVNDGMGHGLAGMRERVTMYGGTVSMGPIPASGFEVAAELPVRGDK